MPENQIFFVGIGVLFGGLAALCAFFIAYGEQRQRLRAPSDKPPMHMALDTALVTFAVFFVAACLLPWVLRAFVT